MAPSARSLGAAMLATAAASPLSLNELSTQVGGDVALRVLPIGDAATYGSEEAPNGYRAELAKLLEKDGNKVEIVGTTLHGDEPVEASSKGETIDELLSRAETAVPGFLPNIVVLNAGTADCEQGADGNEAGDKVVKILELVWDGSRYASVVLATSPLPDDTEVQQCVNDVNNKFRNLVKEHEEQSHKVVLVDLDADKPIDTDEKGIPTKEGYKTVAELLFDGVDDAGERGWLQAPEDKPEDAPEAEEEDDADSEETSESQSEAATPTTAPPEKRQEVNTSMANTALPTSMSKEELDALMDNVMDDSLSKFGWEKRQDPPGTSAIAKKRQEGGGSETPTAVFSPPLDGGASTTAAPDTVPTGFTAVFDHFKDLVANGEDISSLLPEGVSPEDILPGGASDLGALGNQRRQESGVFSPPLDSGSPTTSAPQSLPTDPTALLEKVKELFANGKDISSLLPEGVSPEDILPGGASDLSALGNQRRQESGVFSPPLDGGSPTSSASQSLPTDPTALLEKAKELLANGEDISSLLPEGVSPEDILPGGASGLGALANQRRQEESGVFSPPLDGGSPTTSAPQSLPTDPTALLEKVKELLANGEDISSLLPEGVSPEDILGGGAIGNQRRQESGVFSPPLDSGSPTTSSPQSLPTDPTALLEKVKELLANGKDISSLLPEGVSPEDILGGGDSLGMIGNQRRQEDGASETPSAVFSPPLDGGSSTTPAPEVPTDPTAIFEKVKELFANGKDISSLLPEGVSPEDILGGGDSLGAIGNQRRQEESGVFSPPLDGGSPTTSAPQSLPTDPTAILEKAKELKQLLANGKDISSLLPEGVSPEDILGGGDSLGAIGNQRRQEDVPSELPTSIPTALPSQIPTEMAEALISKGAEQLQARQATTDAPPEGAPEPTPEPTTEAKVVRRASEEPISIPTALPTSMLTALPSGMPSGAAEAIKEALPEGADPEDVEIEVGDVEIDLGELVPSGAKPEDVVPSQALDDVDPADLEARDGLAGLVKDIPGVDDVLPSGIIEARTVHSGAGNLAASGAAVLAAVGFGLAMI